MLTLGIIGNSLKPHERRVPIHPLQFSSIDPGLRKSIYVERDYGLPFSVSNEEIDGLTAGIAERDEIFESCDVVLLFKPVAGDYRKLRRGQLLWGCPHFVQNSEVTQSAIDQRLTVLAVEAMRHWSTDGAFNLFVLHRVCEMAGYSSVQHALQCTGKTGQYGRPLRAAVIGFGSAGRGAVDALRSHAVHDVTVFTNRDPVKVVAPPNGATTRSISRDPATGMVSASAPDGALVPLATTLSEFDVVVNCVLQDPTSPQMFLDLEDLDKFRDGSLIIDVSCDFRMGFSWAEPTTFDRPLTRPSLGVHYYAIDHSPTLFWDSASWVIGEAFIPFLGDVMSGPDAWVKNETLHRAIEVREGEVVNRDILTYQRRSAAFPHDVCQ